MKILVTGGAGFIGSAVVRFAIERGHEIVNLDALTYAGCLENVASVADQPGYVFEHADVRDAEACRALARAVQPDVWINNAGVLGAGDAATQSDDMIESVVAVNLLDNHHFWVKVIGTDDIII